MLWSAPQSWRHVGDGVTTVAITPSSLELLVNIRRHNDVDRARVAPPGALHAAGPGEYFRSQGTPGFHPEAPVVF